MEQNKILKRWIKKIRKCEFTFRKRVYWQTKAVFFAFIFFKIKLASNKKNNSLCSVLTSTIIREYFLSQESLSLGHCNIQPWFLCFYFYLLKLQNYSKETFLYSSLQYYYPEFLSVLLGEQHKKLLVWKTELANSGLV